MKPRPARERSRNQEALLKGRGHELALFTAALALRLVYLAEMAAKSPFWGHPYLDAAYYLDWARQILGGDVIGHEVFIRAPLYPYFLALLGRIFGLAPAVVGIAQALLGSLTCLLVAAIAGRAFGRRTGIVAGWLACVHGPLIYWGGETLIETFLLPLILLSLWATLKAGATGSGRTWALAGLFAGLAAIARPTAMVVLPVAAASALLLPDEARTRMRLRMRRAALALACGGAVLGLVCLRNWAVGGDFVPVASHGGINFWTGNNPRTDGKLVVVPEGIEITPEWKGKDNLIALSVLGAEKALGRHLKPSEVSAYWVGQATGWMRENPGAALRLYLRKIYYFWAGCEYTNNEDIYSFRQHSRLLSALLLPLGPVYLPGALLMPLSLYGIFLTRRSWRRLFPLLGHIFLTMIVVLAFFVSSRHRLPAVPLLLGFAACGALHLWDLRGAARSPQALRAAAVFLPLLFILGINPGARPAATLAQYRQFLYAVRIRRAEEAQGEGRDTQAEREFSAALLLKPEDAETRYELGVLLGRNGRLAEARSQLEAAVRLFPRDPRYAYGLGVCYAQAHETAAAREMLRRAASLGATIPADLLQSVGGP